MVADSIPNSGIVQFYASRLDLEQFGLQLDESDQTIETLNNPNLGICLALESGRGQNCLTVATKFGNEVHSKYPGTVATFNAEKMRDACAHICTSKNENKTAFRLSSFLLLT